MRWTAIVPLKAEGSRKSRLSPRLDPGARERLSLALLDHVAAVIAPHAAIVLLADVPPLGWLHAWTQDHGRGLNAELAAAHGSLGTAPVAVIHPDLPLLTGADVGALLTAGEATGLALAPDRHMIGTNALALADGRPLAYRFGTGSFAAFGRQDGACAIVRRPGLELDVDTPDDLDRAIAANAAPLLACAPRR